jgi:hypothetical protein
MVAAQHAIVLLTCTLLASGVAGKVVKDVTSLQIGVKHRPKGCAVKTKTGDSVSMHYTGEHLRALGCASCCSCIRLCIKVHLLPDRL